MTPEAPDLTVALVVTEGSASLSASIASLVDNRAGVVEWLVLCSAAMADESRTALDAAKTSGMRLIVCPDAAPSALRATALREARGRTVVFMGDRYVAASGWLDALREAIRSAPQAVAGFGAIDPSNPRSLFEWAAYYCEYAPFMRPFEAGESQSLPASNVWLTQDARNLLIAVYPQGASELAWARTFAARGDRVWRDPRPQVHAQVALRPGAYLAERYDHARAWTSERLQRASAGRRAMHALACVPLPLVLTSRIWLAAGRKPGHRWRAIRTLPYLMLFTMTGAAGELIASLRGAPRPRESRP